MATARGNFTWHELYTSDTRNAISFYGKVAAWTTEAWDQNSGYTMFMAGKSAMAGVMKGEPRRWLAYIVTDDAEVAVWEAQRLGGKVSRNTESMPGVGKFAVLQDPWGAVFGVLQPEVEPKPKFPPVIGDFSWHELVTGDVDKAFRFYSALFGWQKTSAMDLGPDLGPYQVYGWKNRELGGIYKKSKKDHGPHRWLCYIKVRDAKASAEATAKAGGRIHMDLMQTPDGDWIAAGTDPQGVEFALHSAKRKAARPAKKAAKKKPARKKPAKKKAPKGKKRR